jgi:HEAT-like repeat
MLSPDASTRQGVCFGLKEVLENISREQLAEYLSQLLPAIQNALTDDDSAVRVVSGTTSWHLSNPR